MITVAIPYYGCPQHVGTAVRSALAQTWQDLQVLVIGDGEAPPADVLAIEDPRLVVYTLPENRGRYFCDAVALQATRTEHYAQLDADDWWEPDRLETLMRYRPGAVAGAQVWHQLDGTTKIPRHPRRREPAGPVYHYRFNHAGIYSRARLEAAGGYHPGYRMSYDTFLIAVLWITGGVQWCPRPQYHRIARPDSLTRAPGTRMGSPVRREVSRRLQALYGRAWALHRAGRHAEIPGAIRATIPAALQEEVNAHARELRGRVQ